MLHSLPYFRVVLATHLRERHLLALAHKTRRAEVLLEQANVVADG